MDNQFNSKNSEINKKAVDKKIRDMQITLMNDEKCKESAQKLTNYISNDNK